MFLGTGGRSSQPISTTSCRVLPPDSWPGSFGFCKIGPNQSEANRGQPNPSEDQGSRQRIAIIGHLTAGGIGKPNPKLDIFFALPSIGSRPAVFAHWAILSYLDLSGPISTKKRELLCAAPSVHSCSLQSRLQVFARATTVLHKFA